MGDMRCSNGGGAGGETHFCSKEIALFVKDEILGSAETSGECMEFFLVDWVDDGAEIGVGEMDGGEAGEKGEHCGAEDEDAGHGGFEDSRAGEGLGKGGSDAVEEVEKEGFEKESETKGFLRGKREIEKDMVDLGSGEKED